MATVIPTLLYTMQSALVWRVMMSQHWRKLFGRRAMRNGQSLKFSTRLNVHEDFLDDNACDRVYKRTNNYYIIFINQLQMSDTTERWNES